MDTLPTASLTAATAPTESLDVVWVGDPAPVQGALARRAPYIRITSPDAVSVVEALQSGVVHADVVVIDSTLPAIDTMGILGRMRAASIDLPIVLLSPLADDGLAARAGQLAVCDAVVKTPDFVLQLPPAFAQVRARHDLAALFRASRQTQDRLRTILEFQPAVTCVLSSDGAITAMNQAGLAMLGTGLANVAGQSISAFIPSAQRDSALDAARRAAAGETVDFDHDVLRPDGRTISVHTRAVPFRNAEGAVALATMHERAEPAASDNSALLAERDRLAGALEQVESDLKALLDERDRWTAEREELERTQNAASGQSTAALAELDSLRAGHAREIAEREERETSQRDRATQTDAALTNALAELEAVRSEHARLITEREVQNAQRQDAAAQTGVALATALAELEALRAEHARLSTEHARMATEREEHDNRQRDGATEASSELSHAVDELNRLRAEREQWVAERQLLQARAGESADHSAMRRQLEDEREQLTRLLQTVGGRTQLLEAETRRQDAALKDAMARQAADAMAIAQQDVERATLAAALEQARGEQMFLTTSLDAARSERAQMLSSVEEATAQRAAVEASLEGARLAWAARLDALAAEQAAMQSELKAERGRSAALLEELAGARMLIEEASRLQLSLDADHRAMLQLRDQLLRFMDDADTRCRAIIEHQQATLAKSEQFEARTTAA